MIVGIINSRRAANQNIPPVSGFSFWFRANGLVAGATTTYGITDGSGNISQLTDLGGSTITATQGVGIDQPTLIANRIGTNNRKAFRFSGSPQFLSVNNAGPLTNNVSGATIIAVMKSNISATQQISLIFTTNSTGSSRCDIRATTGDKWRVAGRRLDSDVSAATVDGTANSNAAFTIIGGAINYAAATAIIYENGAQAGINNAFQTAGNTSTTDSAAVNIGQVGSSNYFSGDIGELIFYPRYLSSTEIASIHSWLNTFYGIY